ncbi:MAG: hypothetical protein JSW65_00100 [Candidatus Bipolaricaulota bacterium]|nr:MAG: hypothetical protein JSW65_00100 [Candidatus Bipolaricaulota bacterium]
MTSKHRRLVLLLLGVVAVSAALGGWIALAGDDAPSIEELKAEMIPPEGAETTYGIPLSLHSLPQFIEWWSSLVPLVEADSRYVEALSGLVAPCCDDNTSYRCCCEQGGQSCNIIRSGKGLAAHLIHDLDFDTVAVRESVLEWYRFARPDYYLAAELEARGIDPEPYGLTTYGSCYRGMCSVPISEGGCGGMDELVEPAIAPKTG